MRKTIGGMSHESTIVYYDHIHRAYQARYDDLGYPPIFIESGVGCSGRRTGRGRAAAACCGGRFRPDRLQHHAHRL